MFSSLENSPYHTKVTRAGYTKGIVIPYHPADPPPPSASAASTAATAAVSLCLPPEAPAELRTETAGDRVAVSLSIPTQFHRVSHNALIGKVKA